MKKKKSHIYIYIFYHPLTDYILSQLISVARHVRSWDWNLYASQISYHRAINTYKVSEGILCICIIFSLFTYVLPFVWLTVQGYLSSRHKSFWNSSIFSSTHLFYSLLNVTGQDDQFAFVTKIVTSMQFKHVTFWLQVRRKQLWMSRNKASNLKLRGPVGLEGVNKWKRNDFLEKIMVQKLDALSSCWSWSVLLLEWMRKRLRERLHGNLYYPGKSFK